MDTYNYMSVKADARALLVSEEESLSGSVTLSAETQIDLGEKTVNDFIEDHFATFVTCLRYLTPAEQEMLVSYFLLRKPQTTLGKICGQTQTQVSSNVRSSLDMVAAFVLLGEPTKENLASLFIELDIEDSTVPGLKLSDITFVYRQTRSFVKTCYELNSSLRFKRQYDEVKAKLLASPDRKQRAIGTWMNVYKDKTKRSELKRVDPDVCGQFRIRITADNMNAVFHALALP